MNAEFATAVHAPNPLPGAAQLTPAELEQAKIFQKQTHAALVGSIKGLTAAQWAFRMSPDSWTISETVEHILFVYGRVLGPVMECLSQAPEPPANYDCKLIDAIVIHQLPCRLAKFPVPEIARPAGRLTSVSQALEEVGQVSRRFAEALETTPNLRQHAIPAPPLKALTKGNYEVMDGYQWLLAAAAHAERHIKQILEVRADANFPEAPARTIHEPATA